MKFRPKAYNKKIFDSPLILSHGNKERHAISEMTLELLLKKLAK